MKKTNLQAKHERKLKEALDKAKQGESFDVYELDKSLGYMSKDQIQEISEEKKDLLIDLLVVFSNERLKISNRDVSKQNVETIFNFLRNMDLLSFKIDVAKLIILKNNISKLSDFFVKSSDLDWLEDAIVKKQNNTQKTILSSDLFKKFKEVFHPSLHNTSILLETAFETNEYNKNLKAFFDEEYQEVLNASQDERKSVSIDCRLLMKNYIGKENYYEILEFVVSVANDDFYRELMEFLVKEYILKLLDTRSLVERYSYTTAMLAKESMSGNLTPYIGDAQIISLFELTLIKSNEFSVDNVYIYKVLLDSGYNFENKTVFIDDEGIQQSSQIKLLSSELTKNELDIFFRIIFDQNMISVIKNLVRLESESLSLLIYRNFIENMSKNKIYFVNRLNKENKENSLSFYDILDGCVYLKDLYLIYLMSKSANSERLIKLFENKSLSNLASLLVFNDIIVSFVLKQFLNYEKENGEINDFSFFSFNKSNLLKDEMINFREVLNSKAKEICYNKSMLKEKLNTYVTYIMNKENSKNLIELMPIFEFLNVTLRDILLNNEFKQKARNIYFAEFLFEQFIGRKIECDSLLLSPITVEFDEEMIETILDRKKLEYYDTDEIYKMKFSSEKMFNLTLENYLNAVCMVKDTFVRHETIKEELLSFLNNQVQYNNILSKKDFLELHQEYDTPRYNNELDEIFKKRITKNN